MIKENIIFILEICVLGWYLFKYIRNKKTKVLYGIILFIGMMLWWYPLFLPVEAGFAIWGALGSWIVFKEARGQGKESSLWLVGIMLIGFTIVFLLRTLWEMKVF
ncbi:MAG: hypothetical protein RLZZ453_787 [Chlamydiota bacterium]|jgi:hypothetical protein